MRPFSIAPGGFIGVIGRSGAGKSTLLRMINRLARHRGAVLYKGVDVTALRAGSCGNGVRVPSMNLSAVQSRRRLDVLTNVLMGRLSEIAVMRHWPALARRGYRRAMSALEQFDMGSLAAQRATSSRAVSTARRDRAGAGSGARHSFWPMSPFARWIRAITRIVMDALLRINKHFGITVICNLHRSIWRGPSAIADRGSSARRADAPTCHARDRHIRARCRFESRGAWARSSHDRPGASISESH